MKIMFFFSLSLSFRAAKEAKKAKQAAKKPAAPAAKVRSWKLFTWTSICIKFEIVRFSFWHYV